jgi:hypothetical protein
MLSFYAFGGEMKEGGGMRNEESGMRNEERGIVEL